MNDDIRNKARELMRGACKVCPVCNGRACAGEVPGMGGLGTGSSFMNNLADLASVQLNMRLIHDVKTPSTSVSWLGCELSMPVIASPIGGMFNINEAVSEPEYVMAVLEGCRKAGTIGCTGDGVPPVLFGSGINGVKAMNGWGIPFIKPWDSAELDEKMQAALDTGCAIMGMDIDAAGLATLRKMGRPVAPKSPDELANIIERAHRSGVKFVVKGIMTVADARRAADMGADCIVVSNHGGRVLDHAPGSAAVLPYIAEAVRHRVSIMVDGGVRDGVDVAKMLALGADIVGIGRPVMITAVGGGAEGVSAYFGQIKAQLEQAMILTGCQDIIDMNQDIVFDPEDMH